MKSRLLQSMAIAAFAIASLSGAAFADQQQRVFVYSVKFVCGVQVPPAAAISSAADETPVKPGNYATAVNIHNFHAKVQAPLLAKASLANTLGAGLAAPGILAPYAALVPNQALEIDCPDIQKLLAFPATATPPPFIKGFVEIQSPVQLNVVGVYTAEGCNFQNTPGQTGLCVPSGSPSIEVVPQTPFLDTSFPTGQGNGA